MPLFNNTRPFLLPSVGCATFLLLFSACSAAHAEYRNGDTNTRSDENHTSDFDLGHGSLDDVTLTFNYDGKSYTFSDEDKATEDLIKIALQLSFGENTRHDAGAGKFDNDHVDFRCDLNPWNRNDDKRERDDEKFFSHHEHRGDDRNNYFCDDGDKGHHNNGGGDPNNGCGNNGNSGCGDNGGGGNDGGGGLSATPEPGSVYLSVVAAGLMSVMLVRRGLRLRKATAGVPA